jgi:signal transduction histidine kinase
LPYPPIAVTAIATAVVQTSGFLTFSACVSVLMERLRRQHAVLGRANNQLRQHAAALESLTISRERNRVARELHDTLAHTLSSLSVQLETTKAYWEIDPQAAHALLDRALTATRSGLQETRRSLDALRASPLDDVGLRIALCDLLEAAAEVANLQLDLSLPEQLPPFEPATEQAIYRIVQEAVANVTHHAEARSLSLHVAYDERLVVVRIKDDGRGFDVQAAPTPGHFGLAGMVERSALVGGKLAITSAPGAGTLVELDIAINEGGMHAGADLR